MSRCRCELESSLRRISSAAASGALGFLPLDSAPDPGIVEISPIEGERRVSQPGDPSAAMTARKTRGVWGVSRSLMGNRLNTVEVETENQSAKIHIFLPESHRFSVVVAHLK